MTSKPIPAVKVCSNGNKTFFNSVIAAYRGWAVDKRNQAAKTVIFKDDSDIPPEFITELENFMTENACFYPWQEGDFVMIDNTVAYHSREPFYGRRIVFAAIANGTKEMDLDQVSLTLHNGDFIPSLGLGLRRVPKETVS
jgi:hypothetical protein